ncbi:MAG: hypothetical protein CVV37_01240 [Nitrospira bacterium HGW-Nitrospira-1]|nr:MAG: hypothetical protein CVV37_01240 [Nitrospira bacterium HGW-Nitrospira-1]
MSYKAGADKDFFSHIPAKFSYNCIFRVKSALPTAVFRINVLFCILMLTTLSGAAELEEYHGPEIIVRYEVPLKNAAIQTASDYRKIRTDVETKLGLQLQTVPVVVLLCNNDAFQEMARNKLVTAFAIPERNLIVMDYSIIGRIPFDLKDTFKHELTHILLHQHIGDSSLPKWLDEGVAQWAGGGMADILRTGEKDMLQQAVLSSRLIALKDITATFPSSPNSLILAYEESRSLIEFIVKHYGEAKLRSLLGSLEKQRTIEQAAYENLGVSLDMLEQIWKKSLSIENSWISYIADHIYWLLFFFAALITIAGYYAAKRRLKNYRDEEDETEGGNSEEQSDV